MSRLMGCGCLAAVVAIIVAGCGGTSKTSTSASSSKSLTHLTVQFGYTIEGGAAPVCTAIVNGYYKAQGLNVSLLPGGPVGATFLNATDAVATNPNVNIALDSDIVSLIEAKGKSANAAKGFPVKAFADLWQTSPLAIITRADFPLHSLKEAAKTLPNGHKIVFGSTPGAPIWKAIAQYAGVPESKLDIQTIGGDATALIAGKVDALLGFTTVQGVQAEKAGLKVHYLPISEIPGFRQPTFVAMAREATIAKEPAVLARWLRATIQGSQETIHNPEVAAQDLTDPRCAGGSANKAQELALIKAGAPYFTYHNSLARLGSIDEPEIASFSKAYSAMSNLPHPPTAAELTDTSILQQVYNPTG